MKKDKLYNIILMLMLAVGLSLMLYPTVSDIWNSQFRNRTIANYSEYVATLDKNKYEEIWAAAQEYNKNLRERPRSYELTPDQMEDYLNQLSLTDASVMGYIEIPKINCHLPIYHTTEERILQMAVGHMEWTSLPTGGENTHCAFSGHRGLPSAKLFTDLDQLTIGDKFVLWILDEKLTYEIDQINIVEPNDPSKLTIEEGKDLCTLVTCTPYGVNSHRMLVRGHRVSNMEQLKTIRISADALIVENYIVARVLFVPIVMLFSTILILSDKMFSKKRKQNGGLKNE